MGKLGKEDSRNGGRDGRVICLLVSQIAFSS